MFWKRGPLWALTPDGCEDQVGKPTGERAVGCGTADVPCQGHWVCRHTLELPFGSARGIPKS